MTLILDTIRMPHLQGSVAIAKVGVDAAAHFSLVAGSILIAMLWQGLALAGATSLCLRLAPRTPATLRFALWTAVLILICFLSFTVTAPADHSVIHADPRWSVAFAVLWLGLSLLRAADLGHHALRLRSLSRRAMPISVGQDLASLLFSHRKAQLCTTAQLDRPGVIGFFHPRILIPAWLFDQLTTPELEQIVFHELEHLRRRDDWLNLFQKLALIAFPLNPAMHWIERRLCVERELACDEGVVRRTRAPRLYASCLARLAEHGLNHRSLSLALGFIERQSELARRVSGILSTPRTRSSRQNNVVLTGTVAACLLCGGAELVRCPQIVSFAPVTVAASHDVPRSVTGKWVSRPAANTIHDANSPAPRLVQASLTQSRKPFRRAKIRRVHLPIAAQRALLGKTAALDSYSSDVTQPVQAPDLIAPTLVRYTLVRVEGGWLFLQL